MHLSREKRPAHLIEVHVEFVVLGYTRKDRSHGQCRGGHQRVVRWPACLSFPSRRDHWRCFRVFILIDKSARNLVHHLSENQCHVFADFQRPRFLAARGSADQQKYSTDLSFWIAAITDERTERRNGATLPCGKKLGGGIVGVGILAGTLVSPWKHTRRDLAWYEVLITHNSIKFLAIKKS